MNAKRRNRTREERKREHGEAKDKKNRVCLHGKHLSIADGGSGVFGGNQAEKSFRRGYFRGNQGISGRARYERKSRESSGKYRSFVAVFFFYFAYERNAFSGGRDFMYDARAMRAFAIGAEKISRRIARRRKKAAIEKQRVLLCRSHGRGRSRSLRKRRENLRGNFA